MPDSAGKTCAAARLNRYLQMGFTKPKTLYFTDTVLKFSVVVAETLLVVHVLNNN